MAVMAAACGKGGGGDKPAPVAPDKVAAKLDKIIAAAKASDGAALGAPGDNLALDFQWDLSDLHPNAIAVQSDQVVDAKTVPQPPKGKDAVAVINAGSDLNPEDFVEHPRFSFQSDSHDHILQAKTLLGVPGAKGNGYPFMNAQLVAAKYVLVVTPHDIKWPYSTVGTFAGGHVKMTAELVDIDTGKPLGGFETTGASSDIVKTYDKTLANAQERVDADFLVQASHAIAKGIQQRWPSAKVPESWQ